MRNNCFTQHKLNTTCKRSGWFVEQLLRETASCTWSVTCTTKNWPLIDKLRVNTEHLKIGFMAHSQTLQQKQSGLHFQFSRAPPKGIAWELIMKTLSTFLLKSKQRESGPSGREIRAEKHCFFSLLIFLSSTKAQREALSKQNALISALCKLKWKSNLSRCNERKQNYFSP